MMILRCPWPNLRQGQICFIMHFNVFCFVFWIVNFLNTIKAKVIILTRYIKHKQKMTIKSFKRQGWPFIFQPRLLMLESLQHTKTVFSSPEPKAHGWANSIPVTPSSVCQHLQTSSPLKPLGQLNSNFIWRLLRKRERKFVQMVLVTWSRWPPRPYMVKKPLENFSRTRRLMTLGLRM